MNIVLDGMRGQENKTALAVIVVMSGLAAMTCVFLPLIHVDLRTSRELLIGIVTICLMAAVVSRYTKTAALLMLYCAVRLFFSRSHDIENATYLLTDASVLFAEGLWTYDRWAHWKGIVYNTVCVIALVNVLLVILQACGVWFPLFPEKAIAPVGLMSNPNETGAFLAVCAPFFFRKRWAWAVIPLIAAIALTRAFQGMVTLAIVVFCWAVLAVGTKKALLIFAACLIVPVAYAIYVEHFDLTSQLRGRGEVWRKTIVAATIKPVMGWGFGQYQYVMPLLTGPKLMGADQTYFAMANIPERDKADNGDLIRAAMAVTNTRTPKEAHDYLYSEMNNTRKVHYQAHNEYVEFTFAAGFLGALLLFGFIAASLGKAFMLNDKLPFLGLVAQCSAATMLFTWHLVPFIAMGVLVLVMVWGEKEECP